MTPRRGRRGAPPRDAGTITERVPRGRLAYWLAVAAGVLALHVGGATVAREWAWGMHAYGFLAKGVLAVSATALAAVCVWAVRRARTPSAPWLSPAPPRGRGVAGRTVAFAAIAAILWVARVRHTSLGDGGPLAESIAFGQRVHPDSPLALAILQLWHSLTAPWIGGADAAAVAARSIALASTLAGGLFALVAWEIAGELSRGATRRDDVEAPSLALRVLLTGTIFLQGYVLLFFGYVETYAFVTLGLAVYAWLSLRALRGATSLVACGAALAVATGFHLMAAVFLPALAVVAGVRIVEPAARRRALVEVALLVVGAGVALALLSGAGVDPVERMLALARTAAAGEGGAGVAGLASPRHLGNAIQAVWLVGPIGALAWAGGLFLRPRGATAAFAVVTGVLALLAMFGVQDLRLGYARDWDLYAAPGLMLTIAGVALWSPRVRGESGGASGAQAIAIAAIAAATSAVHTLPWIAVNASRERAFARLQTLPLGYGRTETAVAFWLAREGDLGEALAWTDRALAENPANLAAWLLRADLAQRAGAPGDEARALKRAARLRPGEVRFRVRLLDALRRAGELELARVEARAWAGEAGGEAARTMDALLDRGATDSEWNAAVEAALAAPR